MGELGRKGRKRRELGVAALCLVFPLMRPSRVWAGASAGLVALCFRGRQALAGARDVIGGVRRVALAAG